MYNDYFSINKNFQASINLELDLNNETKINEYIPTTDICDVLKKYVKTILGEAKEKATTLVGPYGKGKSFLLLILSYLLGNNKESKTWENLVNKIGLLDPELFNLLMKVKEKNISLLTIIINSNYDNIKQAFQIALSESLKRASLYNIIPNSIYKVCLNLITKWEADPQIKNEILKKCLELHKINLNILKKELENFSNKAYKQFEELYNCVNIGLEFSPLVTDDIVKMYNDVAISITKEGYSGLFIVFDEFSKFLESNSTNLMQDLKIIQDIAEAANGSDKNQQINLCCVTHKSLSLYLGYGKKENIRDSFKTVEGRFKEIKFNRSLEENYQLISSAILKKEHYLSVVNVFLDENKDFYKQIDEINLFNSSNSYDLVYKDCFPLNPITVYTLIHLSELVAQNERTLFTFLSDTDDNSLNTFLYNHDNGLFNVDKIYDYFNDLFQKEETNYIRNIWYRAESILAKLDLLIEKRIIKVIAIILMINNIDKLPCNEEIISLALSIKKSKVSEIINSLINRHLIKRNLLNNLLTFASLNSKSIDEKIEHLTNSKLKSIKCSEILNRINDKKYVIPRRYNEENKITRFYSVIFMEENEFNNLYNFDYYFENRYCDGIVINLLKKDLTEKEIYNKIKSINNPSVIVRYPTTKIDQNLYQIAMRCASLEELKLDNTIDEISKEEIALLLEETNTDILSLIDLYFNKEMTFYHCNLKGKSFNETLSKNLENIYNYKLIFNNELINKKNITTQYQKAVNHVIDYLIDHNEEFDYSETSPEASIKYSVLDANENKKEFIELVNDIKKTIIISLDQKVAVNNIMEKYRLAPYGIREGVLPLLLAKAISELSDNIILYLQSKEIELNSLNLVKSINNSKYYLAFSKSSQAQINYFNQLKKLFKVNDTINFRKDVLLLSEKIRKYFGGLPKIIRFCSEKNNYLNLDTDILKYKDLYLNFNINPYDVIFVKPKAIFNEKKYENLFKHIEKSLKQINANLISYKNSLINKFKKIFAIDENTSIKMGMDNWFNKMIAKDKKIIFSDKNKKIFECLSRQIDYDDLFSLNNICKATINMYIEDWDNDYSEKLINELNLFIDSINQAEYITDESLNYLNIKDDNFSDMALILKDSILSVLEEFSDSVENSEKISILKTLIKKLL